MISGDINSLIVSLDFTVNSTHQDLTSLKIWLIFLLSTACSSILISFQVAMLMVPHNLQFTRSFQLYLLGIKLSKNPHSLLYLPVTADTIHSITIWLTGQNGNELNLRGETSSERDLKNIELNKLQFTPMLVKVRISEG